MSDHTREWIAERDDKAILVQVRIQPELFHDDDDTTIPCTCTD